MMGRTVMRVGHTCWILCRLKAVSRARLVLGLKMWRIWRRMRLWYEPCGEKKICGECMI